MISIICVYSNKKSLEENLLKSLASQNSPYDLILVDNRNNKSFNSAASALNYAAKKAKGKYLMFVHQDICLVGNSWLKKAEKILDDLSSLGIAGVAGCNIKNKKIGYIDDGGRPWGVPFKKPQLAQTLDECLVIIPKKVFNKLKFDEKNFDHWHCYAVDYALLVSEMGLKAYALPLFVRHKTTRTNIINLIKYQRRVFNKHKKHYKYICTTCGFLSGTTLAFKEKFPNNKFIDFYWGTAYDSPKGKIFPILMKRGYRALLKKIKQHD